MLTVIPEVKFCFFPQSRKQVPVYRQVPPSIFNLQVPIVTNINFLLTISIHCQEIR